MSEATFDRKIRHAEALRELFEDGLAFAEVLEAHARQRSPGDLVYIEAAQRHPLIAEGELEVDDTAVVSHGDEEGAYVMAWLWVTRDEAGFVPEEED